MEYSEETKQAAIEIFKEAIIHELCRGVFPIYKNENEIDWDFEIEDFLDNYCVALGNEQAIIDYYKAQIEEEVQNRMSLFTCKTDKAWNFLNSQIRSFLTNDGITFTRRDTLFSSIFDIDDKVLFSLEKELDGEKIYFLMDFNDAKTDFVYWSNEDYIDSFAQTQLIKKAI